MLLSFTSLRLPVTLFTKGGFINFPLRVDMRSKGNNVWKILSTMPGIGSNWYMFIIITLGSLTRWYHNSYWSLDLIFTNRKDYYRNNRSPAVILNLGYTMKSPRQCPPWCLYPTSKRFGFHWSGRWPEHWDFRRSTEVLKCVAKAEIHNGNHKNGLGSNLEKRWTWFHTFIRSTDTIPECLRCARPYSKQWRESLYLLNASTERQTINKTF